MRIFISYRRDDAGGHAGRLSDDLGERLGATNVFQDVESIAAGEDFMNAIQRAVAAADVVLVVIGPDWSRVANAAGERRLWQPGDVVALEVAASLSSGRRVVPVLVGGAEMPSESELPPSIAPLARRNAFEVRAATWSTDIDRLLTSVGWSPATTPISALSATDPTTRAPAHPLAQPSAQPAVPPRPATGIVGHPPPSRRRAGPVAAVGVIAALAIVALAVRSSSRNATPHAGATTTSTSVLPTPDTPIALPAVPRTSLAGPSADPLDIEVTSAAYATDNGQRIVRLAVHLRNQGRVDRFVGPKELLLVVDGFAVPARESLGFVVAGASDTEATATFPIASVTANEVVVQVRQADILAEIPLVGSRVKPPTPPTLLTVGATVETAATKVGVGPASIAVLADRFTVTVPVTFENLGAYDQGFFDRDFRLVVDGSSQPPVGLLDDVVAGHASKQATLRWDVPTSARVLVLRVVVGGQTNDVPLTGP